MKLSRLEVNGFKSFAKKTVFQFSSPITAVVGPNGSGKSNVVEAIRFVMGEQSMKSLRGKAGTDLIFKGSSKLSKGNRAGVTLVFNNSDHTLQYAIGDETARVSLDTDEVSISREVYPDGTNRYLINGTEVRLKDVVEVLASAYLGSKAHNIISQGEADHLLNAHPRERKEMLEEALGLKLYHVRLKEAARKLEKTRENLRECELLRRELAPHLKFLKKQVERIEAAKNIREELNAKASEYIYKETQAILHARQTISQKKQAITHTLSILGTTIKELDNKLGSFTKSSERDVLTQQKQALYEATRAHDELSRQMGRIEGMLAFAAESTPEKSIVAEDVVVPASKVKSFIHTITTNHVALLLSATSLDQVQKIAKEIQSICSELLGEYTAKNTQPVAAPQNINRIAELQLEKTEIENKMHQAHEQVIALQSSVNALESTLTQSVDTVRSLEKELRESTVRESEQQGELHILANQEVILQNREESSRMLLNEIQHLCGELRYVGTDDSGYYDEHAAHEALRVIERLKIRLEDLGGGSGGDVLKEYQETEDRDQFLSREINDATQSVVSLESVIADLKQQLASQFNEGLHKVDTAFQNLFTAMFGGGKAKLALVNIEKRTKKKTAEDGIDEPEEITDDEIDAPIEQGVEIAVQLPRKKTTEIEMLSGGERSLTSIALLFALSQVEPPPFLILDETDAALDEANSKRYADLLVELANHSQLIVVTHNRETMTAAQTLYGVTLGSDDASEVLSVELEKAVQYAK